MLALPRCGAFARCAQPSRHVLGRNPRSMHLYSKSRSIPGLISARGITSTAGILSTSPGTISLASGHVCATERNPDWNTNDDFFRYTRGRFIRNEAQQLAAREIKFDMNELARVAAEAAGATTCTAIRKYPEGMYNKTFLMSLDNGQEVVAKVPNPNAGRPYFTTASEVATMDFVRDTCKWPVPRVYKYDCKSSNPVGAEYIIMEKARGVPLSQLWPRMEPKDQVELRLNLAHLQSMFLSCDFHQYGALYYSDDFNSAKNLVSTKKLVVNDIGEPFPPGKYVIGPVAGRDWFDGGRGSLAHDRAPARGPWDSATRYYKAVAVREQKTAFWTTAAKSTAKLHGPGIYQPESCANYSATWRFIEIVEALAPLEETLISSRLWHNNLHAGNIFVDPFNHTSITGVIGWQSTSLLPLIEHSIDPAFLEYKWPEPEVLDDSAYSSVVDPREWLDKRLFVDSRKITKEHLPAAYAAIEYQRTDNFKLLKLGQQLFETGEAEFNAMLLGLRDVWSQIPAAQARDSYLQHFPVRIGEGDEIRIRNAAEGALVGTKLMEGIKQRLGPLWPENDFVSFENYDKVKAELAKIREEIVARYGKTDQDKHLLRRLWPFDD